MTRRISSNCRPVEACAVSSVREGGGESGGTNGVSEDQSNRLLGVDNIDGSNGEGDTVSRRTVSVGPEGKMTEN